MNTALRPGILDQYRRDLFQDFLPFMDRYVVDHEFGGFLCHADRDGTRLGEDKDSWYEGRGIWIYSYLYNHVIQDPAHLEVARKTVESILRIRPRHEPLWPRKFTRTGETLAPDGEIYGTLFIAEGLAEYAQAANLPKYREMAKEIIWSCVPVYDRPDYPANPKHYLGPDATPFPGARVQGAAMVLLRLATQMLRVAPDRKLEDLADFALDALMERHYNPAFDLNNEFLCHDYSLPQNEYAQFVYTGHTIEAMWMVMDEALRRNNRALFDRAAERFRRHLEVSWDGVYGGLFRGLRNVDNNDWLLDKVLWEQEEALIGCLMLIEYRGERWENEMFQRLYRHVHDRWRLDRYGLPLWITAADRKVTFEPHYNRIENYHHPRHLILNMLALERMAAIGK
jgi:N-acylglucosamine 2-epimerase